jgi:UDP-N-acetylglucosamine diphosphorylase/glucosamine-1-phosphate N-acetyltransferase
MPPGDSVMLLCGRLMETPGGLETLAVGHALTDSADGGIVAAHLTRAAAERFIAGKGFPPAIKTTPRIDLSIMHRPWDLLEGDGFDRRLAADAKALHAAWKKSGELAAKPASLAAVSGVVTIHAGAEIGRFVVLDASEGPIVIGAGAHLGAHAVIIGPASIGEGAHIAPHATVKARSAIGPRCKVGGEVGSVVMQGNSNKTHDGHLGDAVVGMWVNLGAGTVNSNLLNTYGEVSMRLEAALEPEPTGRQFMGCVIGDHAKTAIGTRLMTGCVLGTGAMIASSAPPALFTERFTWRTDAGESRYRLDKFLAVAEAVMARRQTALSPRERAMISQLHARVAARS